MRCFLLTIGFLISLPPTGFALDTDHDLTARVKTALAADSALKSLSLMVSVQDGVAVVGGPVPSSAVNDRLTSTVKAIPGVTEARVNCWVPAGENPLPLAVKAKLAPPEVKGRTVALPLALPAGIEERAAYSPVPPPAPSAPRGPSEHPTIPSPRLPMTPSQDVAAAAEAVRSSDARFDGLVLSVSTGTVVIAGTVREGAEAWDLAAAVRRVPGVDRVVVARTTLR